MTGRSRQNGEKFHEKSLLSPPSENAHGCRKPSLSEFSHLPKMLLNGTQALVAALTEERGK